MDLSNFLKNRSKKLLIWDFDKVIFDLYWGTEDERVDFLGNFFDKIVEFDSNVGRDRKEFIDRKYVYPELDEIFKLYGEDVVNRFKRIMFRREQTNLHKAIPNSSIIKFLKSNKNNFRNIIWSNNSLKTVSSLLEKQEIEGIFEFFVTYDRVNLSKPNLEGFTHIESFAPDVKKEEMLMIGDSLRSDKKAAEAAKIDFYLYEKATSPS